MKNLLKCCGGPKNVYFLNAKIFFFLPFNFGALYEAKIVNFHNGEISVILMHHETRMY